MDKIEIRKVAECIVRDLNSLENRLKTVQKMAHSYTKMQIEIVLNHLRDLTPKTHRR